MFRAPLMCLPSNDTAGMVKPNLEPDTALTEPIAPIPPGDPPRVSDRKRRKRAPRFSEIAAEAGVSEATVDRVLNERGRVSYEARDKVIVAAMRLGVRRVLPDMSRGLRHVDVIMLVNSTPMFQRLDSAIKRTVQMLDRHVVVHRIALAREDEAGFANAILSPPYRRSGAIVVGNSHGKVLDAIDTARRRGERVVSMVTDLANSIYVGVDNRVAGRTAGHMIGKLTRGEGRVVVLRGPYGAADHEQRVAGFLGALARAYPAQPVEVGGEQTNDDAGVCFRLADAALKRGPVSAVYNTGCGNLGIHEALRRHELLGRVTWIAHEMHRAHVGMLAADHINLIIDQNPDAQVLAALQTVLSDDGAHARPSRVDLGLFTMANVPDAPYVN